MSILQYFLAQLPIGVFCCILYFRLQRCREGHREWRRVAMAGEERRRCLQKSWMEECENAARAQRMEEAANATVEAQQAEIESLKAELAAEKGSLAQS